MEELNVLRSAALMDEHAIFKKRVEIVKLVCQLPCVKLEEPPTLSAPSAVKRRRHAHGHNKKRFCSAYSTGMATRQLGTDAATVSSNDLPVPCGAPRAVRPMSEGQEP